MLIVTAGYCVVVHVWQIILEFFANKEGTIGIKDKKFIERISKLH